ncbi:MAG: amidohydrolase family protein [Oscillospiraceae bacterium]|nr:amidohydrolase family protein [Oscillospiraceae bacterium]
MLIQNGQVLLFEKGGFVPCDIRVEGGVITAIAAGLQPAGGEECVDAAGCYVTPGLIDAHSHICISEEGMGTVGDDCCDYSGPLTPELEVLDGIYPFDRAVKDSVRAGVTSALVCPGSDGVIGGVCSAIRLSGTVADQMLLRRYAAMKCSLGENPRAAKHGFASRMGVAFHLRKCLEDALEYRHNKEEAQAAGSWFRKDPGMENMLLVLEKKMPLHVHAHRSDDICTAVRIAQEYDLDLVLVHGTDAIPVADYLAQFPYSVIVGPGMTPRSKHETWGKTFDTAGVLHKAGLKVCITADHDGTPQYYLSVYAGLAVRHGLDELEGLKAVTLNPAEVMGIADRKGQLKVGLDADIVIWSKHPFAYDTHVERVFLEGVGV